MKYYSMLELTTSHARTLNHAEYDVPWKSMLDNYLRNFLELCYPLIAESIDWDKSYTPLDKELNSIIKESMIGNRIVDKLYRVELKTNQKTWILVHIEIQGQKEANFEERMFMYRYRFFDRYQKPVIMIAVLTDTNHNWRPHLYREELFGCRLEMEFHIIKLIDYRAQRASLETSSNPFSLVILAHLAAIEKYPDDSAKLAAKVGLSRLLYGRGWNKAQIIDLYRFLDWVITLPEELALQYHHEIERIEEEKHVEYITTAERIGIKKGLERGYEQGMVRGEARVLHRLLLQKFGTIPDCYLEKIEKANSEKLLSWAARLLQAKTIQEVFIN
jgi:hypothetical protein